MRSLCLVASLLAFLSTMASAADRVTVQLDYVVRGNHAMFFVANEKGYFREAGIEVTAIRPGTSSMDALRSVGAGEADFGFGDLPTLAVARGQGVPVVALAAVNQKSPLAMIALSTRKELKTPQDLRGLTVGVQPAGSTYVFLKAFLRANGMSLENIRQHEVTPPYESFLLKGEVDAVPGYIDAEVPELEARSGGAGSLSILLGSDYGYGVLGSGLFTTEQAVSGRRDLVQRFVTAYLKAFADVIADPAAAAETVVKAVPSIASQKEVLVGQLQADIAHTFFSPDTKANGIGWMTKERWEDTTKVLLEQSVLPQPIDIGAAFDNSFVARADPLKR